MLFAGDCEVSIAVQDSDCSTNGIMEGAVVNKGFDRFGGQEVAYVVLPGGSVNGSA